jgi:hypothetical protein
VLAARVRARVVDEQTDLDVRSGIRDPSHRVGRHQIHSERSHFDAQGTTRFRGLGEGIGLSGDQDEVDSRGGQLPREFRADALGAAGHDGPRPILR